MDIQESVKLIDSYLDLNRKVVGVKFFHDEESYENFEVPERESKVTYCNAVNLASKGSNIKVRKVHQGCPNGAVAFGFNQAPPKMASGEARFSKNIYNDVKTSKSVSDDMIFLKDKVYGIAIMPLENFKVEPDVVVMIEKAYNIMRVVHGYSYFNGYSPEMKTVGLQAVCHDLTTLPYEHGTINITFLCPGTRLMANWHPDELGIGMAWKHWYNVVQGIMETTNPFERNGNKRKIIKKMKKNYMDDSVIELNKNYDTGTYLGGPIDK